MTRAMTAPAPISEPEPATDVTVAWSADDLRVIDAYAAMEKIDRAEAIRRLVRLGTDAVVRKRRKW